MGNLLIYDRGAIASGQLWRLATGHLVHFSAGHAFWNIGVLILAGWALKVRKRRGFGVLMTSAAVTSGAALFLIQPSIVRYGGLSALATAAVVYLCLDGMRRGNSARWIWAALLCLTAMKIPVEAAAGHSLFADAGQTGFEVVPLVHLAGGITAGLLWAIGTLSKRWGKGDQAEFSP
jgi:rhomboid family GlyGly-CTERM serine protease